MIKQFVYEQWELHVNDMCILSGSNEFYPKVQNRLVYRVVGKKLHETAYSKYEYTLRPVFDLTERWDKRFVNDVTKLGTNGLVRLDVLDLCRLRLDLDNFILERVRELSTGPDEG